MRTDLQLAEGRALVGAGFLREPEDALADDVLLHLVAAAVDRDRRSEQRHLLEHPVVGSILAREHPVRADDLESEVARQPGDATHHQLGGVGLWSRRLPLRLRRLRSHGGVATDLRERVQLREALPDARVVVAALVARHIDEQLRGLIVALFAPVFFGLAGLSADLTVLADWHLLVLTLGLILIASVGKFGGAFLGGWFGCLSRAESFALAAGMNARGST
ncbi:MAG: cation:proton antiporter, partial [Actinobacteria bacterium]|nr:cation:proton antiporter [Actinomycetota bacterium]